MAIALAMDSFAVSISAGLSLKFFQLKTMSKISVFFAVFQGLMPVIGWFLGRSFENYIKSIDHWVAFLLLSFIGGKMIYESFKHESEAPCINPHCTKTITTLAIATSIDALAVGISFSLLGVEIMFPAFIIGLTTLIFAFGGLTIGLRLGSVLKNKIEFLGGVILIGIGMKILLEHTIFA